jgi:hypothetical protein
MAQFVTSVSSPISEQERAARAAHLQYVISTQRLEGVKLEPEVLEVLQRHINGELSFDEAAAAIRRLPL